FVVPAITTRRASTVVELEDGQSFAVAGLLRDTVRETVSKFPVLGDIPILGALFRSSSFQKNETELVIIVTPRFVTPVAEAELPLPTGEYLEPNDLDFYLMGRLQSKQQKGRTPLTPPAKLPFEDKLEGPVGPMLP
ncbi:MAG: type II and III secretion system protein family protein, partial [Chloroflexota bacterium]